MLLLYKLDNLIHNNKIPHIIFHGSSGSGTIYIELFYTKNIQ